MYGIVNALSEGYDEGEIKDTGFETPIGEAAVFKSGKKIPIEYGLKKYRFRNGITADIYRVKIDTRKYSVNDEFEIRIGSIEAFRYYDSDEHTIMQEYHDERYCVGVIGFDSDYDHENDKFYGEYEFAFAAVGTKYGMKYKIVRDTKMSDDKCIIYTWIVFLPVSDEYDAAEMIDIELL